MGGAAPISWGEINAYSIASGSNLDCWEREALRIMSEQYCSWMYKGKDVNLPSPYNPFEVSEEAREIQRDIVNKQWKAQKAARKAQRLEQSKARHGPNKLETNKTPML
jgi:hypothetical protein